MHLALHSDIGEAVRAAHYRAHGGAQQFAHRVSEARKTFMRSIALHVGIGWLINLALRMRSNHGAILSCGRDATFELGDGQANATILGPQRRSKKR